MGVPIDDRHAQDGTLRLGPVEMLRILSVELLATIMTLTVKEFPVPATASISD
jgi:hypothetical protein